MTDFADRAVAVVGGDFDEDGDATRVWEKTDLPDPWTLQQASASIMGLESLREDMVPTLWLVGESRSEVTGVDMEVMAGDMLVVEGEMVAAAEGVDEKLRA